MSSLRRLLSRWLDVFPAAGPQRLRVWCKWKKTYLSYESSDEGRAHMAAKLVLSFPYKDVRGMTWFQQGHPWPRAPPGMR